MIVRNEKELAEALKQNQNTIEVEGDLAQKVIRIKATGKVAWAIALGAIGVAVGCGVATVATGGAAAPVTVSGLAASGTAAAISLGGVSTTAIAIAVAAGGVAALKTLRKYKITSKSSDRVVLAR